MATQQLLQLAASSGNRYTLGTLALAVERTPRHTQQALRPAIDAGLVQPLAGADDAGTAYRFLHDRVQQAAYLSLDPQARAANHLLLGRLLLAHTSEEQHDGKLFDIVEQLNAGRALIGGAAERVQLASLNLRAGEKARRSAAFQATLEYMRTGLELLPGDAWHSAAALWIDLQLGAAEASYLCGQFDAAEAIHELVRERTQAPLLQVRRIDRKSVV